MAESETIDALVGAVQRGELDLEQWVHGLAPLEVQRLDGRLRRAMARLPVPIGPRASGPAVERRRILERIHAHLLALTGDRSALVESARIAWLQGGKHIDYLEELAADGRATQAALLARALLASAESPHREELEAFVAQLSHPPDGWSESVARFAEDPSAAAWNTLFEFAPTGDLGVLRRCHTIEQLLAQGMDAETLFGCVAGDTVRADVVSLVEDAPVPPDVVEGWAREHASSDALPLWLGLAARAAVITGDRFSAVRLLREAYERAQVPPRWDADFVYRRADEELRAMLARAGIPAPEDE